MRAANEIFAEYLSLQSDIRALAQEWLVTVEALRRLEIAATITACRDASRVLMGEYRDACAARAEELKLGRR